MPAIRLSPSVIAEIDEIVRLYTGRRNEFAELAERVEFDLAKHADLRPLIHSTKKREKDPDHLREKLKRKAREALEKGKKFRINRNNYTQRIGDLAGVRLLHIYTEQLSRIHPTITKILKFYDYRYREDPLVYIWDLEREKFLKDLRLEVIVRPKMYTSVHYVVEHKGAPLSCEIQVRTLAEELWGEVSHKIDYPDETQSVACREQLRALARIASGCTRLVDSIFSSETEYKTRSRRGISNRTRA